METEYNMSPIAEWYKGRSVFITGGTGFVGKVLMEKLLRSCPDIATIYLLIRPKKNMDIRTRLDMILNFGAFEWLKKEHPQALHKLVPILGDIMLPDLGISLTDQKILIDNVSVVFHSAATVKFDDPLKLSVELNVRGTKRIVQLCHKMIKLEALIHVSTAYSNCNHQEISEEVYPPPANPENIINIVEWMDERLLNTVTPKLLGSHPNTYTFTKALAEHVLMEQCEELPVAIVRPSIITAAWQEPMPGWVDNCNGATGLIAAAGKGVLTTIHCNRDLIADFIPVDVVINLMISVAWYTATSRPNSTLIYNCTSGSENPFRWRDLEEFGKISLIKYPFNDVLWYPGGSFKKSRTMNNLSIVACHLLPCYIYDFIAYLSGKKPIMLSLTRKIIKAINCLQFFTTHEWKFNNDNLKQLQVQMLPCDRKIFNFDIKTLNWDRYIDIYVSGIRKYIFKEDPSTFPSAHRHLRKMFWLKVFSQLLFLVFAWKILIKGSKITHHLLFTMYNKILLRLLPQTG